MDLARERQTGRAGGGPVVGAIRERLRLLADDSRVLLACSGGADSAALVLAASQMPRAGERFVVGHVRHDIRAPEATGADVEAVRALAESCGLGFVSAEVEVDRSGSLEAAAREARYGALVALADSSECAFVATGHHAEDQAETVLMRLLRGAGPDGLAGMRAVRPLADGIGLIRPMLAVTRAQCEAVCEAAGRAWREDETNSDERHLRNAVRALVMPALLAVEPAAAERIASTAEACDAARAALEPMIGALAGEAEETGGGLGWPRSRVSGEPEWVLGGAIRTVSETLAGTGGADGRGFRALRPALRAVADGGTDPRRFELPGVEIEVSAHGVVVRAKG